MNKEPIDVERSNKWTDEQRLQVRSFLAFMAKLECEKNINTKGAKDLRVPK